MSILFLILIVLACWFFGYRLLKFFPAHFQTPVESIAASFILGHFVIGWIALILAEIGHFSLPTLLIILTLCLLTTFAGKRPFPNQPPTQLSNHQTNQLFTTHLFTPKLEPYLLLTWLLIAAYLFLRPHQFIIGGADAGVYVNLGAEIATNGSLIIQDDVLANLSPDMQALFLRPIDNPVAPSYLFPAFFIIGEPAGEITPQFYPLHPVWQAIGFSIGGLQTELMLTGLWALLAVLMMYLLVRRLVGWQTAVFILAAMTINGLQVWFARYPVTESLTQFLLWASFWGIANWLDDLENSDKPSLLWPLIAGLTTGQIFLVRIDMIFILPAISALIVWLFIRHGWQRHYLAFFVPFGLLFIHSNAHALLQSEPYFYDLFDFGMQLISKALWLPTVAILLTVIFFGLLIWQRNNAQRVLNWVQQPVQWLSAIIFVGFIIYLWFIRANITPPNAWVDPYSGGTIPYVHHLNLIRLGWYISPIGVWLGALGIGFVAWRANRQTGYLATAGLLFCFIYLWHLRANPHQVYAMRRFVPMVLPFFIFGATLLLDWLIRHEQALIKWAAVGVMLAWLAGLAWTARGLISHVDFVDVPAQMGSLSDQMSPDSILLFNDQRPIGQGDILGTPLRFLHGHDVFSVRETAVFPTTTFANQLSQWQADGRTIYWLDTDTGGDWPLADAQLSFVTEYSLSSRVLESQYVRRPQVINAWEINGRIYQIEPAP